jgi:diguanylate cyclase (GGDEF)-like protein/PAS domain S-box-containing protein
MQNRSEPEMRAGSASRRTVPHRANAAILLLVVFLTLAMFTPARASATAADASIRSIQQLRQLTPDALNQSPEVHVRGVVTYYDSVVPNLFVQDASGGIWVDLRGISTTPPRVGEILDLHGYAASGFAPYIAKPQWVVVGSTSLPKPSHLSLQEANTGSFDSQWVEMEGVVRSFVLEADGDVLVVDAATPTGSFKVRVPGYHAAFPMQWVDAKVRFRGVCGAAFNRRNQLVAIHLFMPSVEYAEVLDPAPADPFGVPATAVGNIRRYSADLTDIRRIKVVGIVTAQFLHRGLFLMDSTGGLYAESQDGLPLQPGDEAEIIGFPAAGNYTPVLKSSTILWTKKHYQIAATAITGKEALSGSYDAQLVSIAGTVRGYHQRKNYFIPVLDSDDNVAFEANLRLDSDKAPSVPVGSNVVVTGVCSVKTDENGNPSEFQIVLRAPADIKVIASPPWLTAGRALSILSGLVVLTLVVAARVLVLRRRVRQQTEIIRLRLENESALEERYRRIFERNLTGLYIANRNGSIVDCNDSCARILGFSNREDLLKHRAQAEQIAKGFYAREAKTQVVNAEHRFRRYNGSWGWVLSSAQQIQQRDDAESLIEGGLVDITDRKLAEERIQFLAYYDSLTGLPNRTLLQDRLGKALATAKRHKDKVAVLFLDLDRFKNINDSLGHSYGDRLLQELATRLQTWAREQDTVARLGGDEFIVVLSAIKEASDAAVAAERVAHALTTEFNLQGRMLNVTCSIGISIYPDHGEDVETLIKYADAAMYSSKEGGRNTFRFFAQEMNAEALERLTLETSLHTALEKQQLFLMYQAVMDVKTGAVTCCEALVRWQHPEFGEIPPDRFIGIAENSGMIVPIGEWVLRTACAQAKAWNQQSSRVIPVAVNVSAVQFRQEGFCDIVKRALRETGLDPRCLELELTESLLLSNEDVMFEVLGELQGMGVKLAIDDFGTGYSSLNYLKQLPVTKLKIDRTFIRDLAEGNEDAAITNAIINLAKCLKLKVTAEGVENEAQLALLREYGCDEAQGYLFGRPLSDVQVIATLHGKAATAHAGKS